MASSEPTRTTTPADFRVEHANDWCPGCGDFGILSALHRSLADAGRAPHEVAVVGGIGCSGKAQYYVDAYSISTLHGRALPYATGIKLANPALEVVIVGGDGDGLGIGAGHFVNAGRRNVDLTYVLFNNEVYGLTKGQAAPTMPRDQQTKSLALPNPQGAINGPVLALASGFTWIARGYAFDPSALAGLMRQAMEHPGLAYLEVLQPCPTYNQVHDREWFGGGDRDDGGSRIGAPEEEYAPDVPETDDPAALAVHRARFLQAATTVEPSIPCGVLYRDTSVATYGARLARACPPYAEVPPARRRIAGADGSSTADLTACLRELSVGGAGA